MSYREGTSRAVNEAKRAYDLFRIICHILTCSAGLILMVSQIITGDIVWASLIVAPLTAIYFLAVRFFGWFSSPVFFLLFMALTFSLTDFNRKQNAVGYWAIKNSSQVSHFGFDPQYYVKESGMTHTAYSQVAIALKADLFDQWVKDGHQQAASEFGKHDTYKAFDDAWDEFEVWAKNGAVGKPPLPTPDFVDTYMYAHIDRYRR